ncbi:MAG: ROK family protein [Alicyclobacillus sp.]|nr:ROK family protein [Alicyclobacillus sp.]
MYAVGVDLGGTKIRAAVVELNGAGEGAQAFAWPGAGEGTREGRRAAGAPAGPQEGTGEVDRAGFAQKGFRVLAERQVPTHAQEGPERVLERIVGLVRDVLDDAGRPQAAGIGVGAPGPLDPWAGVVIAPPNLPGWDRVPLRAELSRELGADVWIDNDANVAALAEHRFGAGKGFQNVLYITISTGIGAGMVVDGRLYRGQSGSAGEIGHMVVNPQGALCGCGNRGCLEAMASGTAMARMAAERIGEPITAADVVRRAAAGDVVAQGVLEEALEYLGIGISSAVNLLNPGCVVLGGGVSQMGPVLLDRLNQSLARRALPGPREAVRLVPAALGQRSGVVGAAALVAMEDGKSGHTGV